MKHKDVPIRVLLEICSYYDEVNMDGFRIMVSVPGVIVGWVAAPVGSMTYADQSFEFGKFTFDRRNGNRDSVELEFEGNYDEATYGIFAYVESTISLGHADKFSLRIQNSDSDGATFSADNDSAPPLLQCP